MWYMRIRHSGKAVIGQSVVGTHEPEGVHLLIRLREAAFIHISIRISTYLHCRYVYMSTIHIYFLYIVDICPTPSWIVPR